MKIVWLVGIIRKIYLLNVLLFWFFFLVYWKFKLFMKLLDFHVENQIQLNLI